MLRVGTRGRRLQPQVAAQVESARVVADAPGTSAQLKARLDGIALTAVNFEVVAPRAAVRASVLGMDIDDAFVAIADLGRQHAGQQGHAIDKLRAEEFSEAGDRLRQEDAVEPVLDAPAVFAVNVDLALTLSVRILADSGRLLQDLREGRVLSLREPMDRLLIEMISRAAGLGRKIVARLIQLRGQQGKRQRLGRFHRQCHGSRAFRAHDDLLRRFFEIRFGGPYVVRTGCDRAERKYAVMVGLSGRDGGAARRFQAHRRVGNRAAKRVDEGSVDLSGRGWPGSSLRRRPLSLRGSRRRRRDQKSQHQRDRQLESLTRMGSLKRTERPTTFNSFRPRMM